MKSLLLALVLAAPASTQADADRRANDVSCTVNVHALDQDGQQRTARRVSASAIPVVVFQGRVSDRNDDEDGPRPPLLFDVFSPKGQRYQVLVAEPRVVIGERDGRRVKRVSKTREAAMAVAGSSIAWTSMFGRWRVEPRIEGDSRRCGQPEFFTIRP